MSQLPDIEIISKLGYGTFGIVYKAYDHINDRKIALKRSLKRYNDMSREYGNLRELKDCQNVVKIIDIFYSISNHFEIVQKLILECCNESLEEFLNILCQFYFFKWVKK